MRILITGSGFIGKALARYFVDAPAEVTLLSRRPVELRGVKNILHDLNQPLSLATKFDLVVHTAAVHPSLKPEPALQQYDSNVAMAQNLAAWAVKNPPGSFLYLSSISVYGDVTGPELREETQMVSPTLYGKTKYLGELALVPIASKVPVRIIRLPGVVGAGAHPVWIQRMLLDAQRNAVLKISNPLSLFNNITHAEQLARLAVHLHGRVEPSITVNVSARDPISIEAVAKGLVRRLKSSSAIEEIPSKKPPFSISTRLLQGLGWQPDTTDQMLDWLVRSSL